MKKLSIFLTLTLVLSSALAEAQNRKPRQRNVSNADTSASYLYAGAYKHEVAASMTRAEISSANSNPAIVGSASYKYMIAKAMQVGGIVSLGLINVNGSSSTSLDLWGTFTYNFNQSWNVSDSFYGTVGLGMAQAQGSDERKFSYMLLAGKRFPIFDKILYTPEAGIVKEGDADMAIYIVPLNISIAF